MATAAQFAADPWQQREIVTDELDWLGDELCRRTGRPREAAGTKGDRHHLAGSHRSQEFCVRSPLSTSVTYTVQPGLTGEQVRHVAGVDFTPGSNAEMLAQSKRLMAAMQRGLLDEVREFYGNVDGDERVDGWDNIRDRLASSDSSHLWHWHLSLDRRYCADQALMERIVAVVLGSPLPETEAPDMDEKQAAQLAELHDRITAWQRGMPKSPAGRDIYPVSWQLSDQAFQAKVLAALATLAGKDWVDEAEIVDGVLAGLGTKPPAEAAAALVAALGAERAAELGALLAASDIQAGQ